MNVKETGFVEFVTTLIGETIDAVSGAQLEQERKIIEFQNDLSLTKEEFIEKYDLLRIAKEELGDVSEQDINDYVEDYWNEHRNLIGNYFKNGFVKTIVDKGKVSAKLMFSINEQAVKKADVTKPSSYSRIVPVIKPIQDSKPQEKHKIMTNMIAKQRLDTKLISAVLGAKRIKFNPSTIDKEISVKPVSNSDLQDLNGSTDIISSIEFEFKTVIAE